MKTYIFADFQQINNAKLNIIKHINPYGVVLGVINQNLPIKYSYSKNIILKEAETLKKLGIDVVYMVWLKRNFNFIKLAGKLTEELCKEIEPSLILFDAENHWHRSNYPLNEALTMMGAYFPSDIPWGVTGLARLHPSLIPLLECCQSGWPQAYSIWKPVNGTHWSHSKATEPITLQQTAYKTWYIDLKEELRKELIFCLNIYWGERPTSSNMPITEEQCFKLCIEETKRLGIHTVGYWSVKHIVNKLNRLNFLYNLTHCNNTNKNEIVYAIQVLLNILGYNVGKIDGIWGSITESALKQFRIDYNIKTDNLLPCIEDFACSITNIYKEE